MEIFVQSMGQIEIRTTNNGVYHRESLAPGDAARAAELGLDTSAIWTTEVLTAWEAHQSAMGL